MKNCKKCFELKSYEEFTKNAANKDGKSSYCKKCSREKSSEYHRKKYIRKFPKEKFLDGKKFCSKCKKYKGLENFYNEKYSWCFDCKKATDKEKYSSRRVHPEKFKDGLIHCRRCEEYLEESFFNKNNKTYCAKCTEYIGSKHNLKRLGITVEEYTKLEKQQNHKCKICGGKDNKRLSVDHDHSCCNTYPACGKCIRGLLCSRCNKALGAVKDDKNLLKKMIDYLEN